MNNPETKQAAELAAWLREIFAFMRHTHPHFSFPKFIEIADFMDKQAEQLASAQRLADGAQAQLVRLSRLENFIAWMRKRVDEANKFNTHTTLTMFLRKLDELDLAAVSAQAPAQAIAARTEAGRGAV